MNSNYIIPAIVAVASMMMTPVTYERSNVWLAAITLVGGLFVALILAVLAQNGEKSRADQSWGI